MNIVRQVGGSVATALFAVVLERQIVAQPRPGGRQGGRQRRHHLLHGQAAAHGRRPRGRGVRPHLLVVGGRHPACLHPDAVPAQPRRAPAGAGPRRRSRSTATAETPGRGGPASPGRCSTDARTPTRGRGRADRHARPRRMRRRGEEATELAAAGRRRPSHCSTRWPHRRVTGEPLAWVTGRAAFGDLTIRGGPGRLRPPLAEPRAGPARRGTGCPRRGTPSTCAPGPGAIAATLQRGAPGGARRRHGHRRPRRRLRPGQRRRGLPGRPFAGVPRACGARPTWSSPWCPTSPRPSSTSSPATRSASRTPRTTTADPTAPTSCAGSWPTRPRFLRPGGALLLELGGAQADLSARSWSDSGYASLRTWSDEDGDVRGMEATSRPTPEAAGLSAGRTPGRPRDRSTTCQRGSWDRYSDSAVLRRPHHVGDVVGRQHRIGVRRQVGHGEELGQHLALEEVGAAVDERGPVAGDGVVAPGVLREDPARMRARGS